ncbi:hypothetical protein ACLI09_12620 [Flavobacterium sp. RHBU_24]|uniref:hypothetical protein n=1 Tax=Flavobacterium sp. RHBU_24 TaxID=3391185 RepID=UPI003984E488
MSELSKYSSTEGLKITYFLGAGASYQALPIWKAQGQSMIDLAYYIMTFVARRDGTPNNQLIYPELFKDIRLTEFCLKLISFGEHAQEYGSIDIYAKRLYLTDNHEELNELKYCLSVYFDIWENFLHKSFFLKEVEGVRYNKIDKRYYSLLSVILNKLDGEPKLNENISFITWNYDLQLEMAFDSFLPRPSSSFEDLDSKIQFMDNQNHARKVLHLNGFRGIFYDGDKHYENVDKDRCLSLEDYLERLLDNYTQFKNPDYNNCIKYAWESNSEALTEAKDIMSKTDVLVIVGYSFPAFNRKLDIELIHEFESGEGFKRTIYQDPFANDDIVNSIFYDSSRVELKKENISQFYIPHEFLSRT